MTVLEIRAVSTIADYFIICGGRTDIQVQAIVENIQKDLKEKGIIALHREGFREANWVLLDYGDVVIHVFQEEERQFYNLERLWGDARVVDVGKCLAGVPQWIYLVDILGSMFYNGFQF